MGEAVEYLRAITTELITSSVG
uniref:Uncharacterized protein n=1 Tax=Rhizophora mucronata TaxID=61149 RepID=A0A2P2R1M4_RHIMU